jgi:Kef-type K+ transport system membrane component KefB/mannitol/fructose-specific phosphotransferase system IIA component (Ntr-type)
LHSHDITILFLGLALLLGAAHALGELARRIGQPVVVGEMIAGLLLGPTCFGALAPEAQQWLFPREGPAAVALDAVVALAVALVLLIAGLEVDLSTVSRQGRAAIAVGLAGLAVPLSVGGFWAWYAPDWWGMPPRGEPASFAVFFGAALAVSALPVIAKIFLDMGLFQSDFGMLVLVAATINNLLAWLTFSVVLGGEISQNPVWYTLALTVGFVVATLTIGRWAADKVLVWVQAHLSWPGGVLGFLLLSCLVGAAATEAIGIHAIFGAFLVGIAVGDSPHLREQTRHIMHRFVEGILAPIFVAAIGLEVNFAANFRPALVCRVVALGIAVKVLGCWFAARSTGVRGGEAWAVGWAMSARGELGIVLGLLAWHAGVIRERLFVALVTLAFVTSGMAAPMLQRLLRRGRSWSFNSAPDRILCVPDLDAADSKEAIVKLSTLAARHVGLDPEEVAAAVLVREASMGTGLGHGLAVPNARLPSLKTALVAVALTPQGLAFDGLDPEPVRVIFLVLTPDSEPETQLQILAAVARIAREPRLIHEIGLARTPTALLAALRVADVEAKST